MDIGLFIDGTIINQTWYGIFLVLLTLALMLRTVVQIQLYVGWIILS